MGKYKIVVVDDEPIILSGIRHLINWEDVDAEIAACAANGEEAYRIIETIHPDIVITDIKMPVMDGLALAGKCSEEFPEIVFIVLTSLAEFHLAKEAIGYGITDYLLKTELDGKRLSDAVKRAEEECGRRQTQTRNKDDNADVPNKAESAIASLMIMRDITNSTKALLEEKGLLDNYALISFVYSFPSTSLEKQWGVDDYRKLQEWEKDIIERILSSSLSAFYPVMPTAGKNSSLIYFLPDISASTWHALSSRIENKAITASSMVTGLTPVLLKTAVCSGRESLKNARKDIELALMSFYLDKPMESLSPSPLDVDAVFPKLETAIAEKDTISCKASFAVLKTALSEKDHSLNQFSFIVTALYSALSSGLSSLGLKEEISVLDAYESSEYITKRKEALVFIADVENSLVSLLESRSGAGSDVADKAREYIMAHIEERISLSDVASYACVSPGYMSKSFKRIMGISLVDYINTMKTEKAKEMMDREPGMRIADIALALGFHNIYYFSKVFRKIEGISPTEYARKRD